MYSALENNNNFNHHDHFQKHQHQQSKLNETVTSCVGSENLNLKNNNYSNVNSKNNSNNPWMNGPLSMSTNKEFSTKIIPCVDSPTSESQPSALADGGPLAFNGNTFVRPNKKERKGLYFTSDEEGDSQKPEIPLKPKGLGSSSPSSELPPLPRTGSHPGDKKFTKGGTSFLIMDEDTKTTSCKSNTDNKTIPTLKFSSPTSASISTDEDTLDLDDISSGGNLGDEKLITFHEVKSDKTKNNNHNWNNNTGKSGVGSSNIRQSPIAPVGSVLEEQDIEMPEAARDLLGGGGNDNATTRRKEGEEAFENSFSNSNTNNNGNHSHSLSTSTEENFECFGEGSESFSILDSTAESNSLQNFRDLNESDLLSSPGGGVGGGSGSGAGDGNQPTSLTNRSAWQRTSLRRTPNNSLNGEGMNHRRWGSFRSSSKRGAPVVASSNALANQLYRSSSYHSSGRSSAGDGEEMYSDSSLEGEVIDLNKKVHHLEERFTVLAENQNDVDDRYTRAKQENAELSTKLFMLEEQLRDVEQRADEKLREEQRRHKDVLTRIEREKQLQLENFEIKQQSLEKEISQNRIEVKRLEGTLERERNEKNQLGDKCSTFEREITSLRDHNRELLNQNRIDRESMAMESAGSQQALLELKRQLDGLSQFHMNTSSHSLRRNDSTDSECSELRSRLYEAEEEIKRLKQLNHQLQETNEELSAQILNQGLEDGRNLLRNLNTSGPVDGTSLASEFEAMSNEETDEYGFTCKSRSDKEEMAKVKSALKDQKEANLALRAYIDGILLNIVEHYPQLLEVKNKNGTNGLTSHQHNGK